jgi:hypothetical protein
LGDLHKFLSVVLVTKAKSRGKYPSRVDDATTAEVDVVFDGPDGRHVWKLLGRGVASLDHPLAAIMICNQFCCIIWERTGSSLTSTCRSQESQEKCNWRTHCFRLTENSNEKKIQLPKICFFFNIKIVKLFYECDCCSLKYT